jgi:hypothetical protein
MRGTDDDASRAADSDMLCVSLQCGHRVHFRRRLVRRAVISAPNSHPCDGTRHS